MALISLLFSEDEYIRPSAQTFGETVDIFILVTIPWDKVNIGL